AVVWLSHSYSSHALARGQERQPFGLLLFRATFENGLGEDLGPRNQASCNAKGAAGELFGHHYHAGVIWGFIILESAITLGNGEPKTTQFAQSLDDGLRNQ